jgi:sterol 14-demethylase
MSPSADLLSSPVVAVPLLLTLAILYFIRPRHAKRSDAPPMVLSSPIVKIPLIGQVLEFGLSPVKMTKRCFDQYGPVFTVPMANKRLTFLIGPEAQGAFCKAKDDTLSQNEVYDFMRPVFGPGVVYDATPKKRQVQFTSMANGLRTSRLKGYVNKIEKETREFFADWGTEGEIDLFHALSELTILTASRTLHGDDVREKLFREVSALYHDLDHGLTPLTVFWPNAPTEAHKKRNAARKKMVDLFAKVIKNRRDNPDKQHSDGTDILSIFMDIKYKDGTKITDEEVTGLLIALLFAGQHTSCISSTWTSLFIVFEKTFKNRIVAEQKAIFEGEEDAPLDFDKINQMQLLHDCMKEALRLCPPLILLIRKAMKDVKVNAGGRDYTIPKDDMVLVSPSVGMRLPEVFTEPDKFDPDRFGPGREEHKSSPYAYLGFGGGMHSCMGQNFAFMQVKTILSILFREFDIEMVADKMPEIDYKAMVVGPKGDCRIRYKRRRS